MAVAFDTFVAAAGHSSTPVTGTIETINITCTGANLLLICDVAIGVQSGSGATPANDSTTITVTLDPAGVNLPFTDCGLGQIHANSGTSGFIQRFYFAAPSAGAHVVRVTSTGFNGTTTFFTSTAGALSFTGADPTTPLRGAASAVGNSASASRTVSAGNVNEMVTDYVGCGSALGVHNQTTRWTDNQSTASQCGCSGAATAAGSAGTVTMTRTVTSDAWASIAFAIQPAGAAAAASQSLRRRPSGLLTYR